MVILRWIAYAIFLFLTSPWASANNSKPNLVFILADDFVNISALITKNFNLLCV